MPSSPPENLDQEFDFYIRFVKPLVLNLPEANDRVKAAAWIQKLRSVTDDLNLRNEYLKLFLFALQRKRLVGPFSDVPPDALEAFPEGNGLTDMMKCLIELDAKEDSTGAQPPCRTEISSDLREYAAVQNIPNYGVHCYLAISSEPLPKWERADQVPLPPGVMRPKESSPDVITPKPGVSWVDNLRKSPCKKGLSGAPCGTCVPPEPCKPVSSTTSVQRPTPAASKKSAAPKKKKFTDDEVPGLGDPQALDMADALLCSPSLAKREVCLEDHDIWGKIHDDNKSFRIICGPLSAPRGKIEYIGGYPVYQYEGINLDNVPPLSSSVVFDRTPISWVDSRPPMIEQKQAFVGVPPEPFNKEYDDPPLFVHPPSWMYPDAPHFRGNDQSFSIPELIKNVWQDQDDLKTFPWDIQFVPDRPLEFHIQRDDPADPSFTRFRLVPPRLADVPPEDRPETVRFFQTYEECSPSQYEQLLREQEEEEEEEEGEENQYLDPFA